MENDQLTPEEEEQAEADLISILGNVRPPMPEGKEHLVYRDFPKMLAHVWEWMKEQMEPYELHLLSDAKYEAADGTMLARGQVWVNPAVFNGPLAEALARDKEKLFPNG